MRVCEFNVENLFISLDYYNQQNLADVSEEQWRGFALAQFQRRQKSLRKLRGLAETFLDIEADIFMLVEVGGEESIQNFGKLFLHDAYDIYFVSGNSKRNIDLAFLVKKKFPFAVTVKSNRDYPVMVESYTHTYRTQFSRDVAELHVFGPGQDPELILLLTHLKSKISSEQDFQGKDVRTAEAKALAKLYESIRGKLPGVPVILGGDLNSEIESPEFENLRNTDLVDFHEVLGTPSPERVSLFYFDYFNQIHHNTLDYLLISPELQTRLSPEGSHTYRYKTFHDVALPTPETRDEKRNLPSDHYPLVIEFSLAFDQPSSTLPK